MGEKPSEGRFRAGKCTVLIMDLIEEVKAVMFETNQHGMILHTQEKSQQVAEPHLEE